MVKIASGKRRKTASPRYGAALAVLILLACRAPATPVCEALADAINSAASGVPIYQKTPHPASAFHVNEHELVLASVECIGCEDPVVIERVAIENDESSAVAPDDLIPTSDWVGSFEEDADGWRYRLLSKSGDRIVTFAGDRLTEPTSISAPPGIRFDSWRGLGIASGGGVATSVEHDGRRTLFEVTPAGIKHSWDVEWGARNRNWQAHRLSTGEIVVVEASVGLNTHRLSPAQPAETYSIDASDRWLFFDTSLDPLDRIAFLGVDRQLRLSFGQLTQPLDAERMSLHEFAESALSPQVAYVNGVGWLLGWIDRSDGRGARIRLASTTASDFKPADVQLADQWIGMSGIEPRALKLVGLQDGLAILVQGGGRTALAVYSASEISELKAAAAICRIEHMISTVLRIHAVIPIGQPAHDNH